MLSMKVYLRFHKFQHHHRSLNNNKIQDIFLKECKKIPYHTKTQKKGIKQIKSSIDFLSPGSPSQYKSTQNNHLKPLIQKKKKKKKILKLLLFFAIAFASISFYLFSFLL